MDEVSSGAVKGGGNRYRIFAIAAVALAAVVGGVVGINIALKRPVQVPKMPQAALVHEGPLAKYAVGSMAKLKTWAQPRPMPASTFNDADGKPTDLSKFKGKVVVVNVWATWCAPCVVEMPTLAALQKRYEGSDLVVVPVSVDKPIKLADAKNFIDVNAPLLLFHDPLGVAGLPTALGPLRGMPSTIIYDRKGREVARLEGEAKWDSPEAIALMEAVLKQ
jgi:thiol-disulfide isomerase/thioredoxin